MVCDLSHSDPLQGYKRKRHYKYNASELDFATPTSSEPVSRGAHSYSTKRSRPAELSLSTHVYTVRNVTAQGPQVSKLHISMDLSSNLHCTCIIHVLYMYNVHYIHVYVYMYMYNVHENIEEPKVPRLQTASKVYRC